MVRKEMQELSHWVFALLPENLFGVFRKYH